MPDPIPAPQSAPHPLYPDGGNDPSGHAEQIRSPATAAAPTTPVPPSAAETAVPAAAAPAAPAPVPETAPGDPAPAAAPVDLAPYAELKLAEGFVVDAPMLDRFKTLAAETGLPPEKAGALLKLYEEVATSQVTRFQTEAAAEFARQREVGITTLNTLPEFQGEAGVRNRAALAGLMDEFGSPEAAAAFDATGAGSNPAIVKMLLSAASALMEGAPTPLGIPGQLAGPQGGKRRPSSAGEALYPDLHAQQARQ